MTGKPKGDDVHRNTVNCIAYGVHLEVGADRTTLLDRLLARLPPGWNTVTTSQEPDLRYYLEAAGEDQTAIGSRSRGFRLYMNGINAIGPAALEDLITYFRSTVELAVASKARTHVFVHAGAIGWRGQAIIFPGHSHTGKSQLVAALLEAGAEYYSDDYAVFDRHGLLVPYSKPLSLRQAGKRRVELLPEALGAVQGRTPLPVGMVVITRYRPGAVWHPQEWTRGRSLLHLFANAPGARANGVTHLGVLAAATQHATILSSERGEARELAPLLLKELDSSGA